MSINVETLIRNKVRGIELADDYSNLISAGAVDILEKIKTYKPNDLQKFIDYYTQVNSFNLFLPKTTYWKETMKTIKDRFNSSDEVRKYFNDNK